MPTLPRSTHGARPRAEPHQARQMAESFGVGRRALRPGPAPLSRRAGERIVATQPRARRPRRRLRHRHRGPAVPGRRLHGARRRARRADGRGRAAHAASRSRWRRSRPGTRPAGRSTRWSPPRPGTGSTRSPARPRPRGCCGPAGGWRCSGTSSSLPPRSRSLRRGLPAGGARLPVRPAVEPGGPGARTRRSSTGPPTGSVTAGGSATPSSGGSTGSGPTPATSGWTCCPPQGCLTRLPPEQLARLLEEVGAAIDAMGGGFTMPPPPWRSPPYAPGTA